MYYWEILDLTGNDCNGTWLRHPAVLLRKTDLKILAGVYVWNPHHWAHPPAYFCVRARLTTTSGRMIIIPRGRDHAKEHKSLIFNTFAFSLCAKVKPFGLALMCAHVGTQASVWAFGRPLRRPQFFTKIATHTRTPIRALVCA